MWQSPQKGGNEMNTPKIVTTVVILISLTFICLSTLSPQEKKKNKSQAEILAAVGFDRTVLLTLVALERNYKIRQTYLPGIHVDDYYAVILNTTKRIALADTATIKLPVSTAPVAKDDSVATKK